MSQGHQGRVARPQGRARRPPVPMLSREKWRPPVARRRSRRLRPRRLRRHRRPHRRRRPRGVCALCGPQCGPQPTHRRSLSPPGGARVRRRRLSGRLGPCCGNGPSVCCPNPPTLTPASTSTARPPWCGTVAAPAAPRRRRRRRYRPHPDAGRARVKARAGCASALLSLRLPPRPTTATTLTPQNSKNDGSPQTPSASTSDKPRWRLFLDLQSGADLDFSLVPAAAAEVRWGLRQEGTTPSTSPHPRVSSDD